MVLWSSTLQLYLFVRGGSLDLLMTDVPDLVQVTVVAPLGRSDRSLLSTAISMAQAVHNLCISRKGLFKHQDNLTADCDEIRELPLMHLECLQSC